MPLQFTCPHCPLTSKVGDKFAGRKIKCKCGHVVDVDSHSVVIPDLSPPEVSAEVNLGQSDDIPLSPQLPPPTQPPPSPVSTPGSPSAWPTVGQVQPSQPSPSQRPANVPMTKQQKEDARLTNMLGDQWKSGPVDDDILNQRVEHLGWGARILYSGPLFAFVPFLIGIPLIAIGGAIIESSKNQAGVPTLIQIPATLIVLGAIASVCGFAGVCMGLANKKARQNHQPMTLWGVGIATGFLSLAAMGFLGWTLRGYILPTNTVAEYHENVEDSLGNEANQTDGQPKPAVDENVVGPNTIDRNADQRKIRMPEVAPRIAGSNNPPSPPSVAKAPTGIELKLPRGMRMRAPGDGLTGLQIRSGGPECSVLLAGNEIWELESLTVLGKAPSGLADSRAPQVAISPRQGRLAYLGGRGSDALLNVIDPHDGDFKFQSPLAELDVNSNALPYFVDDGRVAFVESSFVGPENQLTFSLALVDLRESSAATKIDLPCQSVSAESVGFDGEGRMAILRDEQLQVIDMQSGNVLTKMQSPENYQAELEEFSLCQDSRHLSIGPSFSSDGQWLACLLPIDPPDDPSEQRVIRSLDRPGYQKLVIWNASTGQLEKSFDLAFPGGKYLRWSGDGQSIVVDDRFLFELNHGYLIAYSPVFLQVLANGDLFGVFTEYGLQRLRLPAQEIARSLALMEEQADVPLRPGQPVSLNVPDDWKSTVRERQTQDLNRRLASHGIQVESEQATEFSFRSHPSGKLRAYGSSYALVLSRRKDKQVVWNENEPFSWLPYFVPPDSEAVVLPLVADQFLIDYQTDTP